MTERYTIGKRVALVGVIVNIALSILKFLTGFVAGSTAMIADAVHSTSDIVATLAVMVSFRIAQQPEDENHPYGHEKAESVAAKIVGIFLFIAGIGIGWEAVGSLLSGSSKIPGTLALYAAVISIVVKEALYWYTIVVAKRINSTALKADAWHHRSDAFSSIATLIGIEAARLGFRGADPVAALIVSIMILKVAYEIYVKSVLELMDSSAPPETVNAIRDTILSIEKVKAVDSLKTRIHGNVIYADVEILVDNFISVSKGHDIAKDVRSLVKQKFSNVKDVMVHVNPCDSSMKDLCRKCPHKCGN